MPRIEETIDGLHGQAHTFRFIPPAQSEAQGIPNPCNECHKDKSTEWAMQALKSWTDRSPWRMDP